MVIGVEAHFDGTRWCMKSIFDSVIARAGDSGKRITFRLTVVIERTGTLAGTVNIGSFSPESQNDHYTKKGG
jgi:hypothetical protein